MTWIMLTRVKIVTLFRFVSIPSSAPFMGFKKVIRQNSSLNCTLRPGDGFPDALSPSYATRSDWNSREPGYTRIFTRFLPPWLATKLRALKIQRYLQARTGRSGLHTCTRDFQAETFRVPSPVPWIACINFGCKSELFLQPEIGTLEKRKPGALPRS